MGIGNRIGVLKAVLLVAAGAAGGGAALAVASVPDGNGTYHACVSVVTRGTTTLPTSGPNVSVIDPGAGQQCNSTAGAAPAQTEISWNATGPPGAPGSPGSPGASGPPGPPGKTITVAGGHTLTIGGQVLTVASDPGVTIALPPLSGNGPSVATLQIGSGSDALTFGVLNFSFASPGTATATATASGRRVQVKDISITKRADKSSAKLFQACATGKHFSQATLTARKGGKIYLVFVFKLVAVKTVSWTSSRGGGTPLQAITLSFSQESQKNS